MSQDTWNITLFNKLGELIKNSDTIEESTTSAFQLLEYLTEESREILKYSSYRDSVNERVNFWNLNHPNQGFEKYTNTFVD